MVATVVVLADAGESKAVCVKALKRDLCQAPLIEAARGFLNERAAGSRRIWEWATGNMRNGQNKRMRGRNRHKGQHHSGGGHHNPLTRVYESNGPDVKIRGTAHHIAEKYLQLARDAASSGDPVTAENLYQHAEHYFRLIAAAQEQFRQQNPYYQPPALTGAADTDQDDDLEGDDGAQPAQAQAVPGMQGQPQPAPQSQQNFGGQPYPPREQPQPYGGGQQPQSPQGRPQHYQQQRHQSQYDQQPSLPQPQQRAQGAQPDGEAHDALPAFITGVQPQHPVGQGNGYDAQGGDRFNRRRRRHRGGGGPRADMTGGSSDLRDDGPEEPAPSNN